MTREEAAEIVLAGPQWSKCRHCDDGLAESVYVRLEGTSILLGGPSSELVTTRVLCRVCHGRGVFLKKNWYAARRLLGLPWEVPLPPNKTAVVSIFPDKLYRITKVTILKEYDDHFDRMLSLRDTSPTPVLWCLSEGPIS